MRAFRRGVSLVEVLVAIAIAALLVAILLPALTNARRAALRLSDSNKMRQLTLAMHLIAANHDGKMPVVEDKWPRKPSNPSEFDASSHPGIGLSVIYALSIECDPMYREILKRPLRSREFTGLIYQGKADPSYDYRSPYTGTATDVTNGIVVANAGDCSMLVNAQAAQSLAPMSAVFQDGTSNTIYLAEAFARTLTTEYVAAESNQGDFSPGASRPNPSSLKHYSGVRQATFADKGQGDVYPVTSGSPPVTRGQLPTQAMYDPTNPKVLVENGVTPETMFQCNVPPHLARGKVPYSPYPNGLQCAFADGSVRFIRSSVAESAFWGAVTPAGGEVASLD